MAEATRFTPSLNRAIFADLPGSPAALRGARAFDWLSSLGIARRVRERFPAVGLAPVPEGMGPEALIAAVPYPRTLDTMVEAGDRRADALADDLGAALAMLVATLVLAPGDARASRPEWPVEHWQRWAAVKRVSLGGGIVSGALGRRLAASAALWLPSLGVDGVQVTLADDPASLVLRGAGSRLPDGPAVLVDAGLTSIKPARARIDGGRCVTLDPTAPLSPPLGPRAGALADFLADVAADAAGRSGPSSAGFALATYTDRDGQPLDRQPGLYGSLGEVPLARRLADRLEERLGSTLVVRTVNDGDAAAAATRGVADAVIVLGTAIGVGLNV